MLLNAPVERLVKFDDLPSAEPFLADQKHEGGRLGDAFASSGSQKPPARKVVGAKKIFPSESLRRSAASSRCISGRSCEL